MSDSEELKNKLGDLSQFSNKFIRNLLKIIDENDRLNDTILNQSKNIYNRRNEAKNIWKHMAEDELVKSKLINSMYDIKYRSRFMDLNIICGNNFINNPNVLMSDWIMFNKFKNLEYNQIERLLNYCKFQKIDNNTYQLDGWIFNEVHQNSDGLWYKIEYTNDIPNEYLNNDTDKRLAVRAMIQIMNESPEEFINFNNYYLIGSYENKNDSYLQSWTINNYKSTKIINVLDKKYNNGIIDIDGKMTRMEIIEILYANAINGSKDLRNLNIKDSKIDITVNNFNDNFIGKIGETNIEVKLPETNIQKLDLNNFRNNNGDQRFSSVITNILNNIKYRYNCDKLQKEDVLIAMYNSGNPCGMGITQMDNNQMTLEEAKKLFEQQQYFDYIKGIPIKTSFKMYPIIDYQRYDDYHENGLFLKCIEKLNNNEKINKVQISPWLISKTIKKMLK